MSTSSQDSAATSREYSGRSHSLLVMVPPTLGLIASFIFVAIGPYAWWTNWLIVGAIWGVSKPIRSVFRDAMKYTTYQFRDSKFSWWTCVKDSMIEEAWDWHHRPLKTFVTYLGFVAAEAVAWPLMVSLGAMLQEQVDYG